MSDEKRYRDSEWLRQQYVLEEKGIVEIAEQCGCSRSTIHRWLENHNIERRALGGYDKKAKHRDERYLRKKYVGEGLTTYEIAEECGCVDATVLKWLKKHGIETREGGVDPEEVAADERLTDFEWLHEQYVDRYRSSLQIAEEIGCSPTSVLYWIDRHGIEKRSSGTKPADPRLVDAEWLREQYKEKELLCKEIANKCSVATTVVSSWLKKHGIETEYRSPTGEDHPHWNGGHYPYGAGWTEGKRRSVRERDGYVCQDGGCSVTQSEHKEIYNEKLHVHHLKKARDIDDPAERNAKENLITLCRDCHRRWEKIADAGLVPQVADD